ncbi:hypothetical protein DFAR_2740022 [Desulfarculales bacterium]
MIGRLAGRIPSWGCARVLSHRPGLWDHGAAAAVHGKTSEVFRRPSISAGRRTPFQNRYHNDITEEPQSSVVGFGLHP